MFIIWHPKLFFCSWRAAKTISIVPRPARIPHWLSGRWPCWRCFRRRFRRTRARILPAIARRDIPLWLSHDRLSPFLLYMWTIEASLNSWGRVSLSQKDLNCSVNFVRRAGPPDLNTFCRNGIRTWDFSARHLLDCLSNLILRGGNVELWVDSHLGEALNRCVVYGRRSVQRAIEVFCPSFYYLILACDQFRSVHAKHGWAAGC